MKGQPHSPEAAAPRRNLAVPPPSQRPRTGGTAKPSAHLAAWSPPPRSRQGWHRRRTTLLSKKGVFSQASYRTSPHVQICSFATGVQRKKPQGVALPLLSFSVGQTGTFLCSASLPVTLRETEICKCTESQYPPQPAHGLSLHIGGRRAEPLEINGGRVARAGHVAGGPTPAHDPTGLLASQVQAGCGGPHGGPKDIRS